MLNFIWCGSGSDFSPWSGWGSGPRSWLPNKGSNPWEIAHIGSYSIHFGLPSANWCGSSSGSSLWLWCGSGYRSGFLFDVDSDFYLMRMWIQVTKMMQIQIGFGSGFTTLFRRDTEVAPSILFYIK
jgi:hypothetical protein